MSTEEQPAHSPIGASGAHRWMNCPGSVRFCRELESEGNEFSREGTAAHALAEDCLRTGCYDAGLNKDHVEYTRERATAVNVYLEHILDLIMEACPGEDAWGVEERVVLDHIDPEAFGTADFWCYDAGEKTLHVRDYKHGEHVVVEAEGNPQLLYYAIGVLRRLHNRGLDIERLQVGIIQPRAYHEKGPVRTWTIEMDDLEGHEEELAQAIRATRDPHAPLVAGTWCRFCPAAAMCPALSDEAMAVAEPAFGKVATPRDPAEVADLLSRAEVVEIWLKRLKEDAHQRAEAGEAIPGYKLVAKRATRRWKDEVRAVDDLMAAGYHRDEVLETKLLTPAQLEKAIGKKAVKELEDHISKESSGTNLVKESTPGTPVTPSVQNAFGPTD